MTRTVRTPLAAAVGLAAVAALSACGSDTSGSAASSAASSAGAAVSSAASSAASQASTAASEAASNASTAASSAASEAASATQTTTVTSTVSPTASSTTSGSAAGGKTYTMAVVNDHDNASSCWTVIDGNVYDVTSWIGKHPGGPQRIKNLCGQDGTAMFHGEHGTEQEPNGRLATFKIGTLQK